METSRENRIDRITSNLWEIFWVTYFRIDLTSSWHSLKIDLFYPAVNNGSIYFFKFLLHCCLHVILSAETLVCLLQCPYNHLSLHLFFLHSINTAFFYISLCNFWHTHTHTHTRTHTHRVSPSLLAQSAVAVLYIDCITANEYFSKECPDLTLNNLLVRLP